MKIAALRVSSQLLLRALQLPEGITIDLARVSFDRPDVIELRIRGEQLRDVDVDAGAVVPVVDAQFKQNGPTPMNVVEFVGFQYSCDPP